MGTVLQSPTMSLLAHLPDIKMQDGKPKETLLVTEEPSPWHVIRLLFLLLLRS